MYKNDQYTVSNQVGKYSNSWQDYSRINYVKSRSPDSSQSFGFNLRIDFINNLPSDTQKIQLIIGIYKQGESKVKCEQQQQVYNVDYQSSSYRNCHLFYFNNFMVDPEPNLVLYLEVWGYNSQLHYAQKLKSWQQWTICYLYDNCHDLITGCYKLPLYLLNQVNQKKGMLQLSQAYLTESYIMVKISDPNKEYTDKPTIQIKESDYSIPPYHYQKRLESTSHINYNEKYDSNQQYVSQGIQLDLEKSGCANEGKQEPAKKNQRQSQDGLKSREVFKAQRLCLQDLIREDMDRKQGGEISDQLQLDLGYQFTQSHQKSQKQQQLQIQDLDQSQKLSEEDLASNSFQYEKQQQKEVKSIQSKSAYKKRNSLIDLENFLTIEIVSALDLSANIQQPVPFDDIIGFEFQIIDKSNVPVQDIKPVKMGNPGSSVYKLEGNLFCYKKEGQQLFFEHLTQFPVQINDFQSKEYRILLIIWELSKPGKESQTQEKLFNHQREIGRFQIALTRQRQLMQGEISRFLSVMIGGKYRKTSAQIKCQVYKRGDINKFFPRPKRTLQVNLRQLTTNLKLKKKVICSIALMQGEQILYDSEGIPLYFQHREDTITVDLQSKSGHFGNSYFQTLPIDLEEIRNINRNKLHELFILIIVQQEEQPGSQDPLTQFSDLGVIVHKLFIEGGKYNIGTFTQQLYQFTASSSQPYSPSIISSSLSSSLSITASILKDLLQKPKNMKQIAVQVEYEFLYLDENEQEIQDPLNQLSITQSLPGQGTGRAYFSIFVEEVASMKYPLQLIVQIISGGQVLIDEAGEEISYYSDNKTVVSGSLKIKQECPILLEYEILKQINSEKKISIQFSFFKQKIQNEQIQNVEYWFQSNLFGKNKEIFEDPVSKQIFQPPLLSEVEEIDMNQIKLSKSSLKFYIKRIPKQCILN